MASYQSTGISFATAMECGAFLTSQGFAPWSEGFTKVCDLDGETVDAGYTLTKGRCYLTMKHRAPESELPMKWRSSAEARTILNWFLDGNEKYTGGNVIPDAAGLFYVEVRGPACAPYRLTREDF